MSRPRIRDVRTRLLAIVLLSLAVALAAAVFGFNVLFARTSSRDANALLRTRAASEMTLIHSSRGHLHLSEPSNDGLGENTLWIFEGNRLLERPRARTANDPVARALAGGPSRFVDVDTSDTRLYAAPIVIENRRLGTLVTGLSLRPYEQSRETALIGSLVLTVVLLSFVGLAVYFLLRSALRPVARMTEQAGAWSEHHLDRRFELGEPHDELTRLAATLDRLLDRIAASLRREQRFSAEVSHELRTPLATVITEAEVVLQRERGADDYRDALTLILRNAQHLARTVEALVAAANQQTGPRGTSDAYAAAAEVVTACAVEASERRVQITLDEPERPVRVGVDADLVERILQPVVENACRYGRTGVHISFSVRDTAVRLVVEDDGPGVEADEQELIFDPGSRGKAAQGNGSGAGLGLSLARRLARAAAGDVLAEHAEGGRFVVTLPRA
jgi:two-component system OmpR family sensor kinase